MRVLRCLKLFPKSWGCHMSTSKFVSAVGQSIGVLRAKIHTRIHISSCEETLGRAIFVLKLTPIVMFLRIYFQVELYILDLFRQDERENHPHEERVTDIAVSTCREEEELCALIACFLFYCFYRSTSV